MHHLTLAVTKPAGVFTTAHLGKLRHIAPYFGAPAGAVVSTSSSRLQAGAVTA